MSPVCVCQPYGLSSRYGIPDRIAAGYCVGPQRDDDFDIGAAVVPAHVVNRLSVRSSVHNEAGDGTRCAAQQFGQRRGVADMLIRQHRGDNLTAHFQPGLPLPNLG